jgi:hypothetical protein
VCWDDDHPLEKMRRVGLLDDLGPIKTFFFHQGAICFVLDPEGLRGIADTPA